MKVEPNKHSCQYCAQVYFTVKNLETSEYLEELACSLLRRTIHQQAAYFLLESFTIL